MNTSGRPTLALTEEEAKAIREDFAKAKKDCAENAIKNISNDINYLDEILPIIQDENVSFDELVTPLHNLISIVPEEQYRVLGYIKILFYRIPSAVRSQYEVRRVCDKLFAITKSDVDSKVQTLDLSVYWTTYRSIIYKFGLIENKKQINAQESIKKEMLKIALNTAVKRTRGLESAKKFVSIHGRTELEGTGDNH